MITYQKEVDGIIYEQTVASKDTDAIKELELQGWSKVQTPPAKAPVAVNVAAPAPKAK